ncbi:citrinin polyketide synthase [Xylaria palmicola]|nr:citrinin polyketide synthase [Xylaria palmicola]
MCVGLCPNSGVYCHLSFCPLHQKQAFLLHIFVAAPYTRHLPCGKRVIANMVLRSDPKRPRQVLLFGPQAMDFGIDSFKRLSSELHDESGVNWALEGIASVLDSWEQLEKEIPIFQYVDGRQLLQTLREGLRTGSIPQSLFPLPNILLTPLVIVSHISQYSALLRNTYPNLSHTDRLPASLNDNYEVLGLCTGILSAFVAACASTLSELEQYAAVAVRLAGLIGALVDAEEASPDSDGSAVSLSASWGNSQPSLNEVLNDYLEAYVSVLVDERRSTVTVSKHVAPKLVEKLKSAGISVTEIPLRGRFHSLKHKGATRNLIAFCDRSPEFQFPQATQPMLKTWTRELAGISLHEAALKEILLKTSDWMRTFSTGDAVSPDKTVICFGSERCVPPTIRRKHGSQIVYAADVDPSRHNSSLPLHNPTSSLGRLLDDDDYRVAIIGVACHVPGAEDLAGYWKLLTAGVSQHKEVPPERFSMTTPWRELDPSRKWYGNFIDDFDCFDHKFFKKSPREMASTDPQHRLVMKLAYQAVEQSGYFGTEDADKHIGCYIGVGNVDYNRNIACYPANAYSATGNLRSFIAGKVSHHFGWTGPSLTIDTACSSSSVAIHQACRAILNGECSSALAGGINIMAGPDWFYNMAGASFLSPTGQCKPFDAKADGYCRGEGAGIVMLKKLSSAVADGDQVFGVIGSTRVYQNQNCTAITVPNALSLSELFSDVVRQARLEPQAVTAVEAHGTGTPVGDPAEYDAIRKVFGGSIRSDTLSVTSVKGLLGHTEFASGVLSLIKVILMINEGQIPPQASFTSINPALGATPADSIDIPTQLKPWNAEFRASLINNYGASGSNASMIVTQAPKRTDQSPSSKPASSSSAALPFWFCGQDERSLRAYVTRLRQFLDGHRASSKELSISNLSFQLSRQSNRSLPQGLIFSAGSRDELYKNLTSFENNDKTLSLHPLPQPRLVILCFGGQVSTYVGLDRSIYENTSVFRGHLDHCNSICLSLGLDSIYPDIFLKVPVQDTVKLQVILFATQYSCARAWIDCGLKVTAVVGHSFGELTALCIAGAYSLEDAFKLVSGRARLVRDVWGGEKGAMIAVEGDLADVNRLTSAAGFSIACYNGPRSFTLAGPAAEAQAVEDIAKSKAEFSGIKLKRLNVTNAFHCSLVDPLKNGLTELGNSILFAETSTHVERATEHEFKGKLGGGFVAQHMRNPVFFNHAVQRLQCKYPGAIWLEAGSNSTVTNMASRALGNPKSAHFQPVNITSDDAYRSLVNATTKLWKEGLRVNFWGHHASQVSEYNPIFLPPYQFEKSRHWMELKSPPKMEIPAPDTADTVEVPQGLTTLIDYQNKSARFAVNTSTQEFQYLASANVLANTAAVAPNSLYMGIVLDALTSLKPELEESDYRPELVGMSLHSQLRADITDFVNLDAVSLDDNGLGWNWEIKSATAEHAKGTVFFRSAKDLELLGSFQSLSRLSGRKRCLELLEGEDAEDVLQGRNLYRAFEQVFNYRAPLRCVSKILGRRGESAGRISVTNEKKWGSFNPAATESLFQVASIYVNLMTGIVDVPETGIFLCEKIDRWLYNPGLNRATATSQSFDVFAVHQDISESEYVSDIFAFDPREGTLVEVILGMHHRLSLRKDISMTLDYPKASVQGKIQTSGGQIEAEKVPIVRDLPASSFVEPQASQPLEIQVNGVAKEELHVQKVKTKITPKSSGPNISKGTREIICNLSGLEPEEINDESDLVELGIDSLMAMEVVREVEATFKCKLRDMDVIEVTDFKSLVTLIRTTLGLDASDRGSHTSGDNISSSGQTNEVSDTSDSVTANEDSANGITEDDTGLNKTLMNSIKGVNGSLLPSDSDVKLEASSVRDVFGVVKWMTDQLITDGRLGDYYYKVMPKATELAIAYIVAAFEQLGCSIRSAAPGQRLERIVHIPRHQKFVDWIYSLLEHDGRLIDVNGSEIIRTAVAPPSKPADTLLQELLRDEPDHAAEHKLMSLVGPKLSACLSGKEDGLHIIFGTPEGREIATEIYTNAPCMGVWIQQLGHFLEQLIGTLGETDGTLRILEIGAGTGGTTANIVPLLARLGVPVRYTVTDISTSFLATCRKRFKQYPFVEFNTLDMESPPDPALLGSQHIVLATNCIHETRDLSATLSNCRQMLRPDGFLLLLTMASEEVTWAGFALGLMENWWSFNDERCYPLAPVTHWEKVLHSVGYGNVDWTEGELPESNIQRLIIAHATGPRFDRVARPPPLSPIPVVAQPSIPDTTKRWEAIEGYISKYTKDFCGQRQSPAPLNSSFPSGKCVIVTGATGSLGSHIVANLAQLPDVQTVVCLNRLSATDATVRQHSSLEMRGISLAPEALAKLKVIGTDTSKLLLGLAPEIYDYVVKNVTHIVHSAWPMSLTRPIRGYEIQFKIFRNLLDLACAIGDGRPDGFRVGFQFVSSIAVVGNYFLWKGEPLVPEGPTTIDSVPATGYADAKLTCEHILARTLRRFPDRFRAMAVRIAQISGSTRSGYWNPTEYMPFLIKSSQVLRALPDLDGTLSWYPVDRVAATLGDLLASPDDVASELIYHVDNPARQTWKDMIRTLYRALNLPPESVVPFDQWISRVRRFRSCQSDNPALQLIEYFQHYFVPMSCGDLILDTTKTGQHSKTLRTMGPVDDETMMKSIVSWKQSGFLHQ